MPTLTPVSNPTASPSSIPTSPSSFPTATPTFSHRPSSSPTTVAASVHDTIFSILSKVVIVGLSIILFVWPTSRNFVTYLFGALHGYCTHFCNLMPTAAKKSGYERVPDGAQKGVGKDGKK
jgi:hypothetical protein